MTATTQAAKGALMMLMTHAGRFGPDAPTAVLRTRQMLSPASLVADGDP